MSFRGALAEELAESLLSRLGYRIVERKRRVKVRGVEVAEIDLIAEKEGTTYAVEVKSGKVSVTDVRQAFSNARLVGAEALVVSRGFSNEAAEVLAGELGVKVIVMDEFLGFVSLDDLAALVSRVVEETVANILLAGTVDLNSGEERVLEAIATTKTLEEAAERLGVTKKELGRLIAGLRRKGVITSTTTYKCLRAQAALALDRARIKRLLGEMGE